MLPDALVALGVALALLVASLALMQAAADALVQAATLSPASLALILLSWRSPAC